MLEILYEDKDIIVVVKPTGMPSQKDLSKDMDLYTMVCDYLKSTAVGLIQRLDRPVGGIVLMTKSSRASKKMTAMIQGHKIDKRYLAIACGEAPDKGRFENYFQKVRGNRAIVTKKKVSNSKVGVLTYECLERKLIDDKALSLLEVKIETGRFHQIRSQLAQHKLPLLGDTKYNDMYKNVKGWHAIGLYAYKLSFSHPVSGEEMLFEKVPEEEPFTQFRVGQ